MAGLYGFIKRLPSNISSKETSGERVTSTVSINDICIAQGVHSVGPGAVRLGGGDQDSLLWSLCEDDNTGTGRVGLGEDRNRLCDGSEVFGVREPIGACPCLSLSLISDDDIGEGNYLLQLGTEELGDEGCREVEYKGLESKELSIGVIAVDGQY